MMVTATTMTTTISMISASQEDLYIPYFINQHTCVSSLVQKKPAPNGHWGGGQRSIALTLKDDCGIVQYDDVDTGMVMMRMIIMMG